MHTLFTDTEWVVSIFLSSNQQPWQYIIYLMHIHVAVWVHWFIAWIALIRIQTTYLDGSDVMRIRQSFLTAYQGGLDLLQVGQSFIIWIQCGHTGYALSEIYVCGGFTVKTKGDTHLKPPKFEHIFEAVITFFFSLFCANTFDTSLLLIVCALKWYIKCLYRHLFLEDISKHARVTQKMALPNLWQS